MSSTTTAGTPTPSVSGSVPASASGAPPKARVRSIDWHRTLVVFVMIECHALVFLNAAHDQEPLRQFLNAINGLVAPSFIFLAGLTLAYGVGGARDAEARRARLRSSLLRIGEVLLVANVLRCTSSPALIDPAWHWWLQVDILTCIGGSLLLLQLVLRAFRDRTRAAGIFLRLAAFGIFAAAPVTETVRDAGPWTYLLNGSTGSMFPLFPWCALALLGGGVGMELAHGGGRGFLRALVETALLYGIVSLQGGFIRGLYGPTDAYILVNAAERVWKVAVIAIVLRLLEDVPGVGARADGSSFLRLLTVFGRSSLSAYAFHLLFIYGGFGTRVLDRFHGKTGWAGYALLAAVVIGGTWLFCFALERFAARRRARARPS